MDKAPSHSRQINKVPNTSTKNEIIDFVESKGVSMPDDIRLKKDPIELVNLENFSKTYAVDEMVEKYGTEVLRLPPYFPFLTL